MKLFKLKYLFSAILTLGLSACGGNNAIEGEGLASPSLGPGDDSNINAATFTEVENLILAPRCYTCHTSGEGAVAGFVFNDYDSILFGFVQARNLDSALYRSVERTVDPMPRGGSPLTSEELEMMASWILNGALND